MSLGNAEYGVCANEIKSKPRKTGGEYEAYSNLGVCKTCLSGRFRRTKIAELDGVAFIKENYMLSHQQRSPYMSKKKGQQRNTHAYLASNPKV